MDTSEQVQEAAELFQILAFGQDEDAQAEILASFEDPDFASVLAAIATVASYALTQFATLYLIWLRTPKEIQELGGKAFKPVGSEWKPKDGE